MDSLFLDTSGIHAWTVSNDPFHQTVVSLVRMRNVKLVVTDYVLDEACTLLLARGLGHRRRLLIEMVRTSRKIDLRFVGDDRFWEAAAFMLKHADQAFSFTDCTSFVVMRELGIRKALTNDADFRVPGFEPLLV